MLFKIDRMHNNKKHYLYLLTSNVFYYMNIIGKELRMATNEINIAFAADENYVQPMSVAITSILKNASKNDKLSFYILCNNISTDSKNWLLELKKVKDCKITFFDINNSEFSSFNVLKGHITVTAYFRMKLADLLPDINKIIYLDCDVIVKTSLYDLFETDISGYYIAAVEDIGCTYLRKYRKDICPYDFMYINSGVLLINLEEWRKDNIPEQLFKTAESGVNHFQHDQEIINIVCHDKCLQLDLSWNVQDSFYRNDALVKTNVQAKYIRQCAKNPKIIHYTFKIKPWDEVTMPMAREWWYYNKFSTIPLKMTNSQKLKFWFARYGKIFSVIINDDKFIIKILGIKFSSSLKK